MLDFKQAISLQLLNKMMYHRKIPQMFGTIYGSRIEECIIVYSVYRDRKNAVSVFVGKTPTAGTDVTVSQVVSNFMIHHPMFAQKYEYLNICWPCAENNSYLVAVFKYKRDRYLDIKPAKLFYQKDNLRTEERMDRIKKWVDNEHALGHWSGEILEKEAE